MTLATRCSACGTSFRVVQDQLKVSGGWVRCGRCNEVFNALEGLYEIYTQPGDLSTGLTKPGGFMTAPAAAPAAQAAVAADAMAAQNFPAFSRIPPAPPRQSTAPTSGFAAGSHYAGAPRAPVIQAPQEPNTAPEVAQAAAYHQFAAAAARTSAAEEAAPAGFDDIETRLELRPGESEEATPSFMQGLNPPERKKSLGRGSRVLWTLAMALLGGLLVLQAAMAWRDSVAARWPQLRPALATACQILGCTLEPLRRMASLSVEGSNLRQRSTEGGYELLVNVRNRGDLAVMMPAFELTLTDTQGQPLIRRVLRASEMGVSAPTVAAGTELSLQAQLDVKDRRVAGYTVEIFYP